MSDLEYEYLITVEKLDFLLQKKQEKNEKLSLIDDNMEECNIKNSKEKNNNIEVQKKESNDRENDIFEEIYSKFNGNYDELVEEFTQTLIKFEDRKIKKAYYFGIFFCIISLTFVVLFSNIIPM